MYRITADWDFKNKFKIAYYLIKTMFIVKNIKYIIIRPSNSKGYHLIVWTSKFYTIREKFRIRKRIGDDKGRIRLDRRRRLGRNTLFYKKEETPRWMMK